MNHREATSADLPTIKELLNISKLPSDDIDDHIDNFIVIEEKGNVIGVGGLEIYDDIGLVRSIAVVAEHRSKGIGEMIYRLVEDKANDKGINTLYLLTESATEYFKKFGFITQERSEVPASIAETKQFRELCPSSAKLMFHKISDMNRQ